MTNHSAAPVFHSNGTDLTATFEIYGVGTDSTRLYPGTIYKFYVSAQNNVNNANFFFISFSFFN